MEQIGDVEALIKDKRLFCLYILFTFNYHLCFRAVRESQIGISNSLLSEEQLIREYR